MFMLDIINVGAQQNTTLKVVKNKMFGKRLGGDNRDEKEQSLLERR